MSNDGFYDPMDYGASTVTTQRRKTLLGIPSELMTDSSANLPSVSPRLEIAGDHDSGGDIYFTRNSFTEILAAFNFTPTPTLVKQYGSSALYYGKASVLGYGPREGFWAIAPRRLQDGRSDWIAGFMGKEYATHCYHFQQDNIDAGIYYISDSQGFANQLYYLSASYECT